MRPESIRCLKSAAILKRTPDIKEALHLCLFVFKGGGGTPNKANEDTFVCFFIDFLDNSEDVWPSVLKHL